MTNEQKVYEYLTKTAHFNDAVTCGILANMKRESNFKTQAVGDKGTSIGLCQWHNGRADNLKSFCASKGLNYLSVEGQCAFLVHELTKSVYYKHLVGKYIGKTDNTEQGAYDFAHRFCLYYEAPASKQTAAVTRGNIAREYFSKYHIEKIAPTPKEAEPIKVGDIVNFVGVKNYRSANAKNCYICLNGKAKVTKIYRLGKSAHPYHLKGIKPCTVNGWVDEKDVEKLG